MPLAVKFEFSIEFIQDKHITFVFWQVMEGAGCDADDESEDSPEPSAAVHHSLHPEMRKIYKNLVIGKPRFPLLRQVCRVHRLGGGGRVNTSAEFWSFFAKCTKKGHILGFFFRVGKKSIQLFLGHLGRSKFL